MLKTDGDLFVQFHTYTIVVEKLMYQNLSEKKNVRPFILRFALCLCLQQPIFSDRHIHTTSFQSHRPDCEYIGIFMVQFDFNGFGSN